MTEPHHNHPSTGFQPQWQPAQQGRLIVNCSHTSSAFILEATGPRIQIAGLDIKANWGPWPIDLPAGNYTLRVSTRYLGDMGEAETRVQIPAGGQTEMFYRAPATIFTDGTIGETPQPTAGMAGAIVMTALPIVVALVFVISL